MYRDRIVLGCKDRRIKNKGYTIVHAYWYMYNNMAKLHYIYWQNEEPGEAKPEAHYL